jgi:uncharacterized membrane protein
VFAIAITLLVLDVRVPSAGFDNLWHGIAHEWPAYLGYVTSFLTIGGIWLAHHGIFRRLQYVNDQVMRSNLLLLMAVSFLPYPTRLVAEAIRDSDAERAAVVFYGASLLVIALLVGALWGAVVRDRSLMRPDVSDRRSMRSSSRRRRASASTSPRPRSPSSPRAWPHSATWSSRWSRCCALEATTSSGCKQFGSCLGSEYTESGTIPPAIRMTSLLRRSSRACGPYSARNHGSCWASSGHFPELAQASEQRLIPDERSARCTLDQ